MRVAVIDDSVPDERVAVRLAPLDALGVHRRIVARPPRWVFERNHGCIGEALLNDCAEHVVALLLVAVNARLMRELETNAVALYPTDCAIELAVFIERQSDVIPQLKYEIATDHCAAGGQVDQLDDRVRAFVAQDCLFRRKAVAVPATRIAASALGPGYDNAVERVCLGPLWLLGAQKRIV